LSPKPKTYNKLETAPCNRSEVSTWMLLRIQGFLGCDAGSRSSSMRRYVTMLVFRNILQECDALISNSWRFPWNPEEEGTTFLWNAGKQLTQQPSITSKKTLDQQQHFSWAV